jgi:hypothetical protein
MAWATAARAALACCPGTCAHTPPRAHAAAQALPLYALEDHNRRLRAIKYTPQHAHCVAALYGPLVPPNTGAAALQLGCVCCAAACVCVCVLCDNCMGGCLLVATSPQPPDTHTHIHTRARALTRTPTHTAPTPRPASRCGGDPGSRSGPSAAALVAHCRHRCRDGAGGGAARRQEAQAGGQPHQGGLWGSTHTHTPARTRARTHTQRHRHTARARLQRTTSTPCSDHCASTRARRRPVHAGTQAHRVCGRPVQQPAGGVAL